MTIMISHSVSATFSFYNAKNYRPVYSSSFFFVIYVQRPLYLSDMRLHSVYIHPEWYSTKPSVYREAPPRSPTAYLLLAEKVPLSCAFYMY